MSILHKKMYWLCIFLTVCTFSAGFILAARWEGVLIVVTSLSLRLLLWKKNISWFPATLLVMLISSAVYGVNRGVQPLLLILGVTTALGCWEIEDFNHRTHGSRQLSNFLLMENKHIQSLGMVLLFGGLLSGVAILVNLHLPFFAIGLLILAALLGLNRLYSLILNR